MSEDAHRIRNAAAAALANVEHLAFMFRNERAEVPFFEYATIEQRQDALKSLEGAERAVRQMVRALRETSF